MVEQENTTTGENKEQDYKCRSGDDGCCQSEESTQELVREEVDADPTAETPTPQVEEENKL